MLGQFYEVVASRRFGCPVHGCLWPCTRSRQVVVLPQPLYNYVVGRSRINVRSCRLGCEADFSADFQATKIFADGRLYSLDCVSWQTFYILNMLKNVSMLAYYCDTVRSVKQWKLSKTYRNGIATCSKRAHFLLESFRLSLSMKTISQFLMINIPEYENENEHKSQS